MNRAGDLVERSLRAALPRDKYREYQICAAWASAVGPEIADRTWPVRLSGRTLVVGATNAVWVTELGYLSEELRTKLNDALGDEAVAHIRFVAKPQAAEDGDVDRRPETAGAEREPGDSTTPVAAEGVAGKSGQTPSAAAGRMARYIERIADSIQDADLRVAFVRAMEAEARLEKSRAAQDSAESPSGPAEQTKDGDPQKGLRGRTAKKKP